MAIEFIGSSAVYKGTSLSVVPPSGTQPGDLLLFVVDGSVQSASGLTVGTAPNIYYSIVRNGIDSTGSYTALSGNLTAVCLVYRGTNGVPKLASSANITATASATNTAATPTSFGDWLVNIWGTNTTAATLATASGNVRVDVDSTGSFSGLLISDQAPNSTASVAGVTATASAAVIDQQSRVLLEEARVPYSLGSTNLKSTTSLTLDPAHTSEVGDTLFVSFITSAAPTALTVSDSGGNTYTLVASVALNNTAANGTLYLYASYRITNRVLSGFTVTSSNAVLMAASAWGVNAAANLGASQLVSPAVTAFGSSTAPTAQKTGLLTTNKYWAFGIVGTNGPSGDTFTQATGYLTPPVRTGTTGGAATTNRTIAGGWDEITISTAKNYAPTLGTSRAWGEIFVVYVYGTETAGVRTENVGISATESSTATINYNYVATHGESPGNTYYEYVNSPAQSYVTQIAWDTLRGLGTSFQANTTGPVGRVSLHLVPIGSGVYPGNYAIELYPVSSKTGTVGSLIASSQFSLASITADAIYHFSFEGTGASVTAGQWYVVAIKAPTDSLSTVRYPYVFVSNDQGVEESYYTEQINQSAPFILNNTGTWVYDNTRWPLKVSVYGNTIQDIVNGTTPGIAAPITESATGTDVSTQIKSSIAQHSEATSGVYYDFLNTLAPTAFTSITWGSVRGTGVSFQAKTTGPVGSVSLNLASVGTGAYPSNYTVELYSASSRTGAIGSLIASKEFALQSITTAGVYEFSFEGTGASVTAGQWYLVAIKAPTDSTTSARYLFVSLAGGAPGYEQYSNEQYGQSGVYSFNNSSVWEYDTGFAALKVAVYGTDTTLDSQLGGLTLTSARTETGTVTESPTSSMTLYRGTYEASSGERAADGYTTIKVGDGTTTLTIGGSFRVGMHFIAPSTGRLGKVAIQYGSVPTENTDAVAIELWSLASNSVTASRQTLITQYNTTAANLAAGGNSTYKIIADFSDNSSANVTAGNGYAVVIYQQTANYSDVIGYSTVNNGDYLSQYRTTYGIGIIDTLYALKMGIEYQNTNIETVIGIADQNVSASETGSPTDQVTQSKFSAGIVTESDETAPILTGSFTNSGDFNALTISQNCDGLRFTSSYTGQVGTVKVWMARNSSGTNPTQLGAVKIFNISSVTATTLGTLVAQLPIKFTDFTLNTNGETSEFDFSSVSGATLVSGNSYFIVVVPGDDWVTAGGVNSISRQAYYFNGTNYNIFRNVVAYPARALYTMTTGNSISDLGIYYAPMIVLRAGQGLTETNVGGLTLTSSSTETGTSTESNTVTLDISSFATESSSTSEESTNLVEFNSTATETGTVTESNDQSAYVSRAWITDSNNHTYLDTRNGYSLIGSAIQNKQFSEKAYGFTFQANKSGQVGTVFVNGNRNQNGNPAPLQPLRVTIWNADSVTNLPTTELAGLDVPFTSLPNASYSTIQFNFSSIPAAQLISGNKYAITLEAGSDWDSTLTDTMSLALADNSSGKDYVISAYNGSGLYKSFGSSNFVTNKTIYVLRVTIEEPEITLDTTLGAFDTSADVSETGTVIEISNTSVLFDNVITETSSSNESSSNVRITNTVITEAGTVTESATGLTYDPTPQSVLYWVGGSGTMTSSNAGNWALTSGGAPTLFAPSAITDVYFDSNSDAGAPFTVTIAATTCKSITVSGLDQNMTIGGSGALTVGSVSLPATNIFSTYTGNVTYNGTNTQTVSLNGNTFGTNATFNGGSDFTFNNAYTSYVLNSVDYSTELSLYVSCGNLGVIHSSRDGVYWSTQNIGSGTLSDVLWASSLSLFVIVGATGTILTSPDGNTWTSRTSGTTQPIGSILWDGSKLVAIAGSGRVVTSTNAIDWTVTTPSGAGWVNASDIAYNGTTYLAMDNVNTDRLYSSTDLATWTKVTMPITTTTYYSAAWSPTLSLWVVGAGSGNLFYSSDAVSWTNITAGTQAHRDIVWANSKFITVGTFGYVYSSTTGTSFALETSVGNYVDDYIAVNWNGSKYLAVGNYGNVRYSTNGVGSWFRYSMRDVAGNGSTYVICGDLGNIYTSATGAGNSWTRRTSGTSSTLYSVEWANFVGLFIAVSSVGEILTSPDGVTWTPRSSGTTNNLLKVSVANNVILIGGVSGTLLTSTDGITWTQRTVSTYVGSIYSAAYIGGLYLIAITSGTANTFYTSPDLVTWTLRTSAPATGFPADFTPFNGAVYAHTNSVTYSTILKTTDGINWTRVAPSISSFFGSTSAPKLTASSDYLYYYGGVGSHSVYYSYDGDNFFTKNYGSSSQYITTSTKYVNNNFVTVGSNSQFITGTVSLGIYTLPTPFSIAGSMTLTNGELTTNADVTAASFAVTSNTIAKQLNANTTNFILTGTGTVWSENLASTNSAWYGQNTNNASLTLTNNTTTARTVALNAFTTRSFAGLTIGGNNSTSITNITNSANLTTLASTKTVAHTITFTAGSLYNINNWQVQGSAGNLVSLRKSGTGTISSITTAVGSGIGTVLATGFSSNDSIWGADKYVSVGAVGLIRTSLDGINWITRTSGVTTALNGITYGNGLYVAVGASGRILTSPDGIDWTSRTSGTVNTINDICFTGSGYLAVGNSGVFLTSTDGTSWSLQTITGNLSATRCASSGTYHMIGGSNFLWRGSDLTSVATWTSDAVATNAVTAIDYGNGYFVISVATSTSSCVRISNNDGTSWTNVSAGVAGPSLSRFVYAPALVGWIATGNNASYRYYCTTAIPNSFPVYTNSTYSQTGSVAYGRNQAIYITASYVYGFNAKYQISKV